jgi:hypothetical protein
VQLISLSKFFSPQIEDISPPKDKKDKKKVKKISKSKKQDDEEK